MQYQSRSFYLFLLIFLEGYVVLSAEILAIRSTMPYVGSGTDTMSVIIAAVLMPLAFGYYVGGKFRSRSTDEGIDTPRRRLLRNFMIAAIFLTAGLSYITLEIFFKISFQIFGISSRIWLITLYSAIFIVLPIFLLGQTIPLLSNFFPRQKLSETTGRILFFSTLGSFMGAVFCTLVLMTYLGVHHSVTVTIGSIALLTYVLAKKYFSAEVITVTACLAFSLLANSDAFMRSQNIVSNNKYNLIAINEQEAGRLLLLNNNPSSFLSEDGEKFALIEFTEDAFIDPLLPPEGANQEFLSKADILVIGTGGFSLGHEDRHNLYDFIDIDGELKEVTEEHFIKEKLSPNKTFHPVPARAFLSTTDKKYDMIFLDAYQGYYTMPEQLVTREFFQQIKDALRPEGVLVANMVINPNFHDEFSVRLDNTFRSVFPHYSRHIMSNFNGWISDPRYYTNVMHIYHNRANPDAGTVYTDNRNTAFIDKEKPTD